MAGRKRPKTIKLEGALPPPPPPPDEPPGALSWGERHPGAPRPVRTWREERAAANAKLQDFRDRQRADDWINGLGHGAPVQLRGDVARAIAEVALEEGRRNRKRPNARIKTPPLDDVVDHFLRVALGLEWPPPPEPPGW